MSTYFFDYILEHPKREWDMSEVSLNPNITMEMNSIYAILETIGDSDLSTIMTKRMMVNHKKLVAIAIKPEISRTVAIFKRERN
jgi:hypothetical protein